MGFFSKLAEKLTKTRQTFTGGLKSIFYLLSSYRADEGDFVAKGSPIATTNHHIICEMRLNGTTINPWDLWRNMSSLHTF